MRTSRCQFVVLWLAAFGVLHMGLRGGIPGGLVMCFGCGDGGWSIAEGCAESRTTDCCPDEEAPVSEPGACECVDLPIPAADGPDAATPARPGAGSADEEARLVRAPIESISPVALWEASVAQRGWARASAVDASCGASVPMSRRTVLIV